MIRHSVEKSFKKCEVTKAVVYFDLPICITLRGGINIDELQLEDVSIKEMFSSNNPLTGRADITGNEFYIDTIQEGVSSGIILPQVSDTGATIFNGNGTVTLAEVLDGINAIKNGANSNKCRRKSLDNISGETDYFNEGYNILCQRYSSLFYNLYERSELFRPITRLELAYIIVMCTDYFESAVANKYTVGISFDWLRPMSAIKVYEDWQDYKVSLYFNGNNPSVDIKDYKDSRSITEYLYDIKSGKSAMPLPMVMSMVELGVHNIFYYEDMLLNPLREVTRGELCYCLTRLAKGV